jgi:hypothetical protein
MSDALVVRHQQSHGQVAG